MTTGCNVPAIRFDNQIYSRIESIVLFRALIAASVLTSQQPPSFF